MLMSFLSIRGRTSLPLLKANAAVLTTTALRNLCTGLAAEGAADGGSPLSPPHTAVTPFTRTMSEVAASYARGLSEPESPSSAAAARQAASQSTGPPLPHGGSDAESWHSAMEGDTGADATRGACYGCSQLHHF